MLRYRIEKLADRLERTPYITVGRLSGEALMMASPPKRIEHFNMAFYLSLIPELYDSWASPPASGCIGGHCIAEFGGFWGHGYDHVPQYVDNILDIGRPDVARMLCNPGLNHFITPKQAAQAVRQLLDLDLQEPDRARLWQALWGHGPHCAGRVAP